MPLYNSNIDVKFGIECSLDYRLTYSLLFMLEKCMGFVNNPYLIQQFTTGNFFESRYKSWDREWVRELELHDSLGSRKKPYASGAAGKTQYFFISVFSLFL